jgi:hypothetical protein
VGRPPTPSHPHTHACLVMREKHFLCACEERGFRHTRGREQSEGWSENKKWISTVSADQKNNNCELFND